MQCIASPTDHIHRLLFCIMLCLASPTDSFHCQKKLNDALAAPVEALLDGASDDTWPAIRQLLRRETEAAISGFSSALSGFEIDDETENKMLTRLEDYARGVVEAKAKEEAGRVLIRMKDRFELCSFY